MIIIPSYQPPEPHKNLNIYRFIKLHIIWNCSRQGQCKSPCGQINGPSLSLDLLGLLCSWLPQDIASSFIQATLFPLEVWKVQLLFLRPSSLSSFVLQFVPVFETRAILFKMHDISLHDPGTLLYMPHDHFKNTTMHKLLVSKSLQFSKLDSHCLCHLPCRCLKHRMGLKWDPSLFYCKCSSLFLFPPDP